MTRGSAAIGATRAMGASALAGHFSYLPNHRGSVVVSAGM
jgi:hypothetical protein